MNKKKDPQIVVIGLGAFGMALVKTLAKEGANVIAVDNNMNHLDEVKDLTKHTICFDATNFDQLESHGITEVDVAVIAIGEDFEPVVLIAMELINAGVEVYARANSPIQELILNNIGVAKIIHPERQVAERMGVTLHRPGMVDLLELGEDLSIFSLDVPENMIGYTLEELDLRERYGINILAIRRLKEDEDEDEDNDEGSSETAKNYFIKDVPGGSTKLNKEDKLIVFGEKNNCEKMMKLS